MSRLLKYLPDRKVWSGGLVSVLAYVAGSALGLDDVSAGAVALGVGKVAEYLIPASVNDVLKRLETHSDAAWDFLQTLRSEQ